MSVTDPDRTPLNYSRQMRNAAVLTPHDTARGSAATSEPTRESPIAYVDPNDARAAEIEHELKWLDIA